MSTIGDRLRAARLDRPGTVFAAFATITLAILALDWQFGVSLDSRAAPYGLTSLELSGDAFVAHSIIVTWANDQQIYAAYALGLGFLIAALASVAMTAGCLWAAAECRPLGWMYVRAGRAIAWLQVLGGLLYAFGNVALINLLVDQESLDSGIARVIAPEVERWVAVATVCAMAKFAILSAGVAFIALVPIARVLRPAVVNRAIQQVR